MRWRRSPAELRFRAAQESWNLWAYFFPPKPVSAPRVFTRLFPPFITAPPVSRDRLLALARDIADGRIPLLGTTVAFSPSRNPADDWRRDSVNNVGSDAAYFRRLPYLDPSRVGDHKVIWELNRHQHLVVLAQAACLDPDQPVWTELVEENLNSWFEGNPFHRGMNWASALEVAFRALSWIRILHLIGNRLTERLRDRVLMSLYQHGAHIARNISIYFAPNTHLLGEAVCLNALGRMFPAFPESEHWRSLGARWVGRCLETQVQDDGVYFEQSSFYHLYAVDLFLFHAVVEQVSPDYTAQLRKMCSFLAALTDFDGSFPLFGDDDGGRFFHPFGARRFFPRATLTTASFFLDEPLWRFTAADYADAGLWLLGPQPDDSFGGRGTPARTAGVFPTSGFVAGGDSHCQIVFAAKAFGAGSAGHSHAHALHFTLRQDQQDLLVDSGTFTYVSDASARNRFRATSAHNTLRVNSLEQGTPVNPFRWGPDRWDSRLDRAISEPGRLFVKATVIQPNGSLRLARTLTWSTGQPLICDDRVEGDSGEVLLEQFWHVPADAQWDAVARVLRWPSGATLHPPEGVEADFTPCELSECLYARGEAMRLALRKRVSLPAQLRTVIRL